MKHTESHLAAQVAIYLQIQYPDVIYKFDLASDQRLSIQQANRNSKLLGKWSKGSPDLTILEMKKGYGALFIELKADGSSPFKKNGELKKNIHLETQARFHKKLRAKGYFVTFATGFDETVSIIKEYLHDTK